MTETGLMIIFIILTMGFGLWAIFGFHHGGRDSYDNKQRRWRKRQSKF
ncbi:MAG: hypothetical protein LBF68_06785 [Christensenellaceae bacterium]|jgi:hypothetical protein|nr:hypothetical protein [Christensenellaceae bacterium]